MLRKARIDAPGALHHIIIRRIERRRIFSNNRDRNDCIERLAENVTETKTFCFGWALIPNQAHILMRTGQTPRTMIMSRLLTDYVVSYNWSAVKAMRRTKDHIKNDERILGDGEFAQFVLDESKERLEERYQLKAQGYNLGKVAIRVSSELAIDPEQVWRPGKQPIIVKARSLLGGQKAGFQCHRTI